MKSIGDTIKEIRKMKNMKQKDFSELSQASIANIESSKRNITLDKLLSILNDFKMSLREFEYIRNDYKLSETDNIFFDFANIKHSIEIINDEEITQQVQKHLEKNPNDFIPYCIYIIEDVYKKITTQNTYNIDSPEAFQIWSNLYSRQKWSYQEIYIMSKLFFAFPQELGTKVIKRIEKEMIKYLAFFKDIHFDCTFYMNVGKYYTHKRNLDLAQIYLKKALPLSIKYDKVTIENDIHAYLAIISYLKGKKQAEIVVEDCIDRYNSMRKPRLADDLKNDWITFFKNKTQKGNFNEY